MKLETPSGLPLEVDDLRLEPQIWGVDFGRLIVGDRFAICSVSELYELTTPEQFKEIIQTLKEAAVRAQEDWEETRYGLRRFYEKA